MFRTRESLADASTVELTRDPLALSACLKKIAALEYGSEISAARADAFSHFFFAPHDCSSRFVRKLLAVHPPIEKRIRTAEPAWDGQLEALTYEELERRCAPRWESEAASRHFILRRPDGQVLGFTAPLFDLFAVPDRNTLEENKSNSELIKTVSVPVIEVLQDPYGARAFTICALLSPELDIRDEQLDKIRPHLEKLIARKLRKLLGVVSKLSPEQQLYLVQSALPLLEELSPLESAQFARLVYTVVKYSPADHPTAASIVAALENHS